MVADGSPICYVMFVKSMYTACKRVIVNLLANSMAHSTTLINAIKIVKVSVIKI